jgi:hypothetical protein
MLSEELLEACEASCLDDGNVSTSIYFKDDYIVKDKSIDVKDESIDVKVNSNVGKNKSNEASKMSQDKGFDPPKTPNTILTKDELNPTTSSIYINDGQVK